MSRHRCRPTRSLQAAALAAAAFFAALLASPAAAQSINLFVNAAFVSTTRAGGVTRPCVATNNGNVEVFFCPVGNATVPYPQSFGDISNDPEINFENNDDESNAYPQRCVIP